MESIKRLLFDRLSKTLNREKSILLLGPRQTGKTTLVHELKPDLYLSFMDFRVQQRYEQDPGVLISEIRALAGQFKRPPKVALDEIQKVPAIMDAVQILIDEKTAIFILTGSSARRLRNLLPGRVIKYHLDPLTLTELASTSWNLEDMISYGSLPGIVSLDDRNAREEELGSYVSIYLEEEIRKEALVRNVAAFSRFLQLACIESGNIVSFRNLSQEIGISHTSISEYYRILEDCMIAQRIDPITKSLTRKRLSKSSKYLIFDLGVRRFGAMEGLSPPREKLGQLFEQWVGLELKRQFQFHTVPLQLHFWHDHAGPEVDWVINQSNRYIPIEVKWTKTPALTDARHLLKFLSEYPDTKKGYIICNTPRPMQLSDTILALPWEQLGTVFNDID